MATESADRDPHTLLEHAAWLRRLAQSLVGDGAAADDLVQETYVAALRRPPSVDRPLRPWLRRVLENAARFRWRGERNRAAREERVAAIVDELSPSSDELLARHETQRLLARLVSELDEPYRSTILLRYAEGLEPTEIARRLDVPAGTVRWRLKEGLDRLRARLDDAHDGDRRAWIVALGPLARGTDAPAAPVAPVVIVGLIGIALLVMIVLSLPARSRRDDIAPSAHGATSFAERDDDRAQHAEKETAIDRVARIAADHPPGWIAQEGVAPRRIAGRVVDDGRPAAGVVVRLTSELTLAGMVPVLERRTDADGRFDFGSQIARPYALGAAAPQRLAAIQRIDLRDPRLASDTLELALTPCTASYHGTVLDVGGSPIAHAQLLREDVIGTEADDDGRYELCVLPSAALVDQLHVVVRADGYGAVMLESAPSGHVRRDIVLTPEAVIVGRAIDERGGPVADAQIWIEPDLDGRRPPSVQTATLFAVTDGGGRFRIANIPSGRHRIAGAARGLTAQRQTLVVAAGDTEDVTVRMGATARVRGRVMHGSEPVAGARVRVRGGLADTAVSQGDGSFVLDRVPAGEMTFLATPYAVTSPEKLDVVGGAELEVVLEVVPQARISGDVRRHGVPVPYARVDFYGPTQIGVHADARGHYEVDGLRAGSYGYLADDTRRGAFATGENVVIGEAEHRVLDLELASGARVTGAVVDESGRAVPDVFVHLAGPDNDQGRCVTDAAGAFDCAQMTGGGTYVARVYASEDALVPFSFVGASPAGVMLVDGYARVDGLRLAVDPRRLTIRGRVIDAAGAPLVDAHVQAWGDGKRERWTEPPVGVTDVDGAFTISSLAPGKYSLEVAALDGSRATRVVEAGASDVDVVITRPTCADASHAVRLRAEPAGIRVRPPARLVWGERAERIELVGWDVPATVRRGQPFEVTFYFRALAALDRPWKVFVHIDGDRARHNADHEPLGGTCSTVTWQPGDILVDRFSTTIKPGAIPAGRYTMWIGFYTGWPPNWRNFEVHTAPGAMRDATDRIKIADLIVE